MKFKVLKLKTSFSNPRSLFPPEAGIEKGINIIKCRRRRIASEASLVREADLDHQRRSYKIYTRCREAALRAKRA